MLATPAPSKLARDKGLRSTKLKPLAIVLLVIVFTKRDLWVPEFAPARDSDELAFCNEGGITPG